MTKHATKIYSRYNPPPAAKLDFSGEEKITKDSFRDECDINFIMARYDKTGQLPALAARDPSYGDFSDPVDYHESLNLVVKAQETFAALPAAVRAECGNDPEVFLNRVQDPAWALKHELALPVRDPEHDADPDPAPQPAKKKTQDKPAASEA